MRYKLKDLCLTITDGSHYSPRAIPSDGYPMFSVKDMLEYDFDRVHCKRISAEDFAVMQKNGCVPKKGDVLVAKDGSYLKEIFVCRETKHEAILSSIAIFRPNPAIIDSYFLMYLLKSPSVFNFIKNNCVSGSALPRIVLKTFKEVEMEVPSLLTQRKIVKVFRSLDSKIQINSKINGCLLEQVFSKYDALFDDDDSFETLTVSSIGTVVGGGTPSKSKPEFYCEHGVAWVTPKDLSLDHSVFIEKGNEDISELGLAKSGATIMPANTVLFSSRAPIGYTAISLGPISTNQGFKSVIPNPEIGPYFVYCFLKKNLETIEGMASGSTFKEVSGSIMKRVPVNVPNARKLRLFNEFAAPAFNTIKNNEAEIKRLTILRDSLLPKLMSGEIDLDSVEIG